MMSDMGIREGQTSKQAGQPASMGNAIGAR